MLALASVVATAASAQPTPGVVPVQAAIPAGQDPFATAQGFGSVWTMNRSQLLRVDPTTNKVIARIAIGRAGCCSSSQIAVGAGSVWVTLLGRDGVDRIDPATNAIVDRIRVGLYPIGIVVAFGSIWVSNHHGHPGSVMRINPTKNTVVATIPMGSSFDSGPQWLLAAFGSLWVGVPNLSAIVRIDPASNSIVTKVHLPGGAPCGELVASGNAIWAGSGGCGHSIARIDAKTNKVVATIPTPSLLPLVARHGSDVWAVVFKPAGRATQTEMRRIDEATNTLSPNVNLLPLGEPGLALFAFGSLWAPIGPFGSGTTLYRLDMPV